MVYLGSARCGERCEPPLRLMQGVMDRLGFFESRQVAALFLAVEPAHDTLQGVSELLRPLAPRVEGLVGRSFDINTAARALGVASGDVCRSDITLTEQRSQEALHARRFYIVMPDRRIAASIDEAEPHDAVVRHLRLLIANNR